MYHRIYIVTGSIYILTIIYIVKNWLYIDYKSIFAKCIDMYGKYLISMATLAVILLGIMVFVPPDNVKDVSPNSDTVNISSFLDDNINAPAQSRNISKSTIINVDPNHRRPSAEGA